MGSVHEQQKLTEEVDRLSDLPSCIIGHILSFLPTKYAVRTSILSTRWKNNWKSITNLDFNDSLKSQDQLIDGMQASFVNFVYRVLLQLKFSSLNKFRLVCLQNLQSCDASHINSWISAVLLHDVCEIDIRGISFKKTCFLPSDLFKCQTLVVLELFFGVLKVPNSVCLPNLKVLHLNRIKLQDDASIGRLLSSSPVLEDLTMVSCVLANISVLKISSPGLKKLILDKCQKCRNLDLCNDALQLEYLELAGYAPEHTTLKNLHSLVEARINFDWKKCSNSVAEEAITKVFGDLKSKSPVFLKLKKLDYCVYDVYGCSLLKDMLESSPQLETLVLYFDRPLPLENIPGSICKRLKVFQLSWLKGNSKDLGFEKYILKNAKVLERFEIYSTNNLRDIHEELLAFRRASTSCEVVFYGD